MGVILIGGDVDPPRRVSLRKRFSTPSPSVVSATGREVIRMAQLIAKDYRESYFDVYEPPGGAPAVSIARTEKTDSTGDTVANNEQRLKALSIGVGHLDEALDALRSAHGLIARAIDASKHESKGSEWTAKDLEKTEARARDANPRGMSRNRVAVRSMR